MDEDAVRFLVARGPERDPQGFYNGGYPANQGPWHYVRFEKRELEKDFGNVCSQIHQEPSLSGRRRPGGHRAFWQKRLLRTAPQKTVSIFLHYGRANGTRIPWTRHGGTQYLGRGRINLLKPAYMAPAFERCGEPHLQDRHQRILRHQALAERQHVGIIMEPSIAG
jgi:hypothetical protein